MRRYPSHLNALDFLSLELCLESSESLSLDLPRALRLRPALLAVAQGDLLAGRERAALAQLLHPPLPTDPLALKRHQQPAPALVWRFDPRQLSGGVSGGALRLQVLLFGDGLQQLGTLLRAVEALGQAGLWPGSGGFSLAELRALDLAGNARLVWRSGQPRQGLAPPVQSLGWWLDAQPESVHSCLTVEFLTPARLLSKGRPLFQPSFGEIFPFLLRRVTGMLSAHYGLELADDLHHWRELAASVDANSAALYWHDWFQHPADSGSQQLGGLCGRLELSGEPLYELWWLLALGSLFGIGKGAAWGAGRYVLRESCEK